MRGAERGFLLLTSHLGDPRREVLTAPQLRTLAKRVRDSVFSDEDRPLRPSDLTALGYSREMAGRIVSLLEEESVLDYYLNRGKKENCVPISRVSRGYPLLLRQRLGLDSPGCLWAKGELSILNTPMISLVGSRELNTPNREFAQAVGYHAAEQG